MVDKSRKNTIVTHLTYLISKRRGDCKFFKNVGRILIDNQSLSNWPTLWTINLKSETFLSTFSRSWQVVWSLINGKGEIISAHRVNQCIAVKAWTWTILMPWMMMTFILRPINWFIMKKKHTENQNWSSYIQRFVQ